MIKACQSLTSRGYLKTQFSWQYYYYTLTTEGLDYLREWLHLPAEIVPATHVKQARSHAPPRGMLSGDSGERRGGGRGGPPGERGDREGGYRRRFGDNKEGGSGAPGEFQPQLYVSSCFCPHAQDPRLLFGGLCRNQLLTDCVIAVVGLVVGVVLLLRQLKCCFTPYTPFLLLPTCSVFSSLVGRAFFFMIQNVAISFGWAGLGTGKSKQCHENENKIQKSSKIRILCG